MKRVIEIERPIPAQTERMTLAGPTRQWWQTCGIDEFKARAREALTSGNIAEALSYVIDILDRKVET
jgi:hypothetical protein